MPTLVVKGQDLRLESMRTLMVKGQDLGSKSVWTKVEGLKDEVLVNYGHRLRQRSTKVTMGYEMHDVN